MWREWSWKSSPIRPLVASRLLLLEAQITNRPQQVSSAPLELLSQRNSRTPRARQMPDAERSSNWRREHQVFIARQPRKSPSKSLNAPNQGRRPSGWGQILASRSHASAAAISHVTKMCFINRRRRHCHLDDHWPAAGARQSAALACRCQR